MSENFESQLNSYTESKRKQYASKAGPVTGTPAPITTAEYNNERFRLLSGNTRNSNQSRVCLCFQEFLKGNCLSCKIHENSIEVLNLPLTEIGVPIRIHFFWPLLLILSTGPAFMVSLVYGVFSLVMGGPILFTTILIHELGHCIAALKMGGDVHQILLWPLGGLAYISFFGESSSAADAIVAVAGPLTHVPQYLFWYILMYLSNGGQMSFQLPLTWGKPFWLTLCSYAMMMQIVLFVFNLIPAYPLDGGRLLAALLGYLQFNRSTNLRITALTGSFFGWYFLFGGIQSFSTSSFTFFSGWNEIGVALFILYSCFGLWRVSSQGDAAEHPGFQPAHQSVSSRGNVSAPFTAPPRRTQYTMLSKNDEEGPSTPSVPTHNFGPGRKLGSSNSSGYGATSATLDVV